MIITITSDKGGVGKTMTAIHIAAFLQKRAPTLLVDGDGLRCAVRWNARGDGLPFKVVGDKEMGMHIRNYEHIVIDTQGKPDERDLKELVQGCDVLILPTEPGGSADEGLIHTLERLRDLKSVKHKVLITKMPPEAERMHAYAIKTRNELEAAGFPVFQAEIEDMAVFQLAEISGVPVYALKGERNRMRAWAMYESVGKEIIDNAGN